MNSNQHRPELTTYQPNLVRVDDLSLVDIAKVLLRRKNLILGTAALALCIGLVYVFTANRVYQVETILLPPSFENIQPLNVLNSSNLNSDNVFEALIMNLNSRKFKKTFFDKFKILETLSIASTQTLTEKDSNKIFENFSKAIKVKVDKKANSVYITLEGANEEKLGLWLDDFVVMANQETKNQLIRNLQSNINSKIKILKISISSKRSIYKQRRQDELGRLEEAFETAKILGIRGYNNVNSVPTKNNQLSIYLQEKKIYMQGTRILQAEMDALKNRKSDDIHIEGLRDLQEQLTRLEIIKIEKENVETATIDKKAIINVEPIRPKRKLIVILSLILGVMIGFFAIFILEFISKLKKQPDSVDAV